MPVLLILVGTDLELLRGGAALHLHILGAGLLLRYHGIHCQLAELEFGVESEELLAALNERGVQRKGDGGSLGQLHYVVFLAFVSELDFVLEVEGGLGVPVDVKVD